MEEVTFLFVEITALSMKGAPDNLLSLSHHNFRGATLHSMGKLPLCKIKF